MPGITRSQWLAINYAVTIFVSAFLLFQVQPIVSKYILPWFGGSPAVWTTCMLFFQTLLFAGYAYAHFSSQRLSPKQQALLHLAIILTALVMLRVVPGESAKPTDSSADPIGRILLLLATSVGLPYFVLSTTGPLVQSWFARSFPGRTPYRLYALSNLGSLFALLSYPVFFERIFDVQHQAAYWSWGFFAFAACCAVAAISLWRPAGSSKLSVAEVNAAMGGDAVAAADGLLAGGNETSTAETLATEKPIAECSTPHWWQYALWLILPALASITLLATTNHVCTDVAVMPFLWVIPLSLYLLTFIIAFDHTRWYRPAIIAALTLVVIYWVGVGKGETDVFDIGLAGRCFHWASDHLAAWRGLPVESYPESPTITIGLMPYLAINFLAMFGICMLCHGELVRQRPHPKYLTAFYLLISAGGASGAMAVTLLTPRLFNTFYEWELSTFFGYLLCVGILLWALARWAIPSSAQHTQEESESPSKRVPGIALLALLVFVGVVGWIDLSKYLAYDESGVLYRTRNFFGTLQVREFDKTNPDHYMIFKHGATTHGLQFAAAERRQQPTTYYTPYSGVGRTINFLHGVEQAPPVDQKSTLAAVTHPSPGTIAATVPATPGLGATKRGLKIGAVGLGVGTLATYVGPGDSICFYEINPAVIDIAENGKWFTYLSDCRARGGHCETKLGDARLTLEHQLLDGPSQHFDLLVLDAFSGDAIPAHLLTEQAFEQIYLPHMAAAEADGRDGAIAIHITNHYVNLEPVVRGLAERFGLQTVRIDNPKISGQAIYHADWIILTRNKDLIAALAPFSTSSNAVAAAKEKTGDRAKPKPAILWTDGFSNLFDVLK